MSLFPESDPSDDTDPVVGNAAHVENDPEPVASDETDIDEEAPLDVAVEEPEDADPEHSDEDPDGEQDAELQKEFDRKLQRIQNKQGKELNELKQALGALLQDPESRGPQIEALRQRLGMAAPPASPVAEEAAQRRRDLLSRVDPEMVDPFRALAQDTIESTYLPMVRDFVMNELASVKHYLRESSNEKLRSEREKWRAIDPSVDRYWDKAETLKSAADKGGASMTWSQALAAASNGAFNVNGNGKRIKDQKEVMKRGASERPGGAPAGRPKSTFEARRDEKTGRLIKPSSDDILRSFKTNNPKAFQRLKDSSSMGRI
jgi:hypothetical protein